MNCMQITEQKRVQHAVANRPPAGLPSTISQPETCLATPISGIGFDEHICGNDNALVGRVLPINLPEWGVGESSNEDDPARSAIDPVHIRGTAPNARARQQALRGQLRGQRHSRHRHRHQQGDQTSRSRAGAARSRRDRPTDAESSSPSRTPRASKASCSGSIRSPTR